MEEAKMISVFHRFPALTGADEAQLAQTIHVVCPEVERVTTEWKFYVDSERPLTEEEQVRLHWLLSETFQPQNFGMTSRLKGEVIEIGPRLAIVTPESTNAVSICQACGLTSITRIERAKRYSFRLRPGVTLDEGQKRRIVALISDRMTEEWYQEVITTFDPGVVPEPLKIVPLIEEGMAVLERVNREYGLSLHDPRVRQYVYHHFVNVLKRNPTMVELFKFGQLNSNHCRHNHFRGLHIIDGIEQPKTLFGMIRETVAANPGNVLVAFKDNAAAFQACDVVTLIPVSVVGPSPYQRRMVCYCSTLKVETHNFPTGVCPPPGAASGTGGEIRDRQNQGRGGIPQAGLACYFVGHLRIPGYEQPWEKELWEHPGNQATPLEILIGASNGASDYGNCFGQPMVVGSTRSYEASLGPELIGYTKPVMVAGGFGVVDERHAKKDQPEKGMLVVQIGGDAYPIGFGGASASSMGAGDNLEHLDYDAVQRANPEMEQRDDRVFTACSRLGDDNPIVTCQDLGAGGDCTAPDELVYPEGAHLYLRRIPCGDKTMSVLVYLGNESQERSVVLVQPDKLSLFEEICQRERCPMAVIGYVTGDGQIVVEDEEADPGNRQERFPVELGLDFLLGDLPQMVIEAQRVKRQRQPLRLPDGLTIKKVLDRVFRLVQVGSKHFLTRKVDRSVGGLIAQQQTVGPLQLTLADYAVIAHSHFSLSGRATSIGDQPVKGVVNTPASGRMSIGEALTNLVWAKIDDFGFINFSATWQWPGGEEGEDASLYDTVEAATQLCLDLGLRIAVGKDSLSMTTQVEQKGKARKVKAPGTVEFITSAPMSDVRQKVTPDLKRPGSSKLMLIDLAGGQQRLGGSALAQVFEQVGDEVSDVEQPQLLRAAFEAVQEMIERGLVLSGHDRSEGGLITTLLEMAFGGNCGLSLDFAHPDFGEDSLALLFNEELGLVIEYLPEEEEVISDILRRHQLTAFCYNIGMSLSRKRVLVRHNGQTVLDELLSDLFRMWQETSYRLDRLQANPACADEEWQHLDTGRVGMKFRLGFEPKPTDPAVLKMVGGRPKVAILREEGTNGDKEMVSVFFLAGFEPWDVTMTDLAEGRISLDQFRGVAFPGGFSFKDVLDAGKGWAAVIKFNPRIAEEFQRFLARTDTFSLGVCNGCQAMALLGIVPGYDLPLTEQPRFLRNESEIFESRFVSVQILESPSIFLKGMAGSTLGVWVAHAEGRFKSPSQAVLDAILAENLAPIRFVNDQMEVTEQYPFNPNRSPMGVTALISVDGRHLAMMPHPERLFQKWQWPYWPADWSEVETSPWLRLFQNAYAWCMEE